MHVGLYIGQCKCKVFRLKFNIGLSTNKIRNNLKIGKVVYFVNMFNSHVKIPPELPLGHLIVNHLAKIDDDHQLGLNLLHKLIT